MLKRQEAIQLGGATGPDLHQLCNTAARLRDQHWGERITYSRKVFIPLTNMCRDRCGYCTFVQSPDSPQANLLSPAQVMEIVNDGEQLGCKEALLSLGEKPEQRHQRARDLLVAQGHQSMAGYLRQIGEQILRDSSLLPHINAGTLSRDELRLLKPVAASMGMMLESVSRRLLAKGMAHHGCPDKVPVQRLRTLERAGQLDVPFTTGILIGIGENWQERIDSLLAINELHLQYGHIQEVIVQNFRAKAGTAMAAHPEPDLDDMRRTLAVARLLLHPTISLQAPPNLAQRYGSYISAGINDWGGISPLTLDHINPERAWPQIDSLGAACQGLGYRLQERLTVYPRYQSEQPQGGHRYLAAGIAARLPTLAAGDGLAAHQWQ
ncbi:7,8-didemethyl-8-hydroxy-5-deazariboflavin synthase CofG [Marinobacterium arenosum]|uniref:7,8-didemethyl-8-hydroxy-5-deazariboflavin synthase CofG n=1 Tax=Marinobacterium arenosum TaxID=2862496 RepID=UPI001C97134D|nr:7,8-didemethyl-8-hydroxy-5-deazariboflavin synthase CofG [Marinobacterium arenosum]MBY4677015.1 7,8-didemethyl-8-hydroxy-5-deazariboflavin synthase CofG [Marinobacterium arenosum]